MKKLCLAINLFLLFTSNIQSQTLIFSDEFNYAGLPNNDKWGNEIGYIRNNELQYYTDQNLENQVVKDGYLEIIGLQKPFHGYNYTSASINTKNKFSFTYGTIKARMKLPKGQGLWTAFWMLGTNIDQVGWPNCGEIDVVEHLNDKDYVIGTAHWSDSNNVNQKEQEFYTVDVTQWHEYAVIRDINNITWYVDDIEYHKINIAQNINGTEELHNSHYILLNLAVGGDWPGAPDNTTIFPAKMFVDYVRVYNAEPNIALINPGFESSTESIDPWTSWGDVSVKANNANTGNNAVYIDGSGAVEQVVTVEPNTTYTLSGFGKVSVTGQNVVLSVKDYGGLEKAVGFDQTTYLQNSLEFTTGATDTSAKIFFYVGDGAHAAYGDDFTITTKTLSTDLNILNHNKGIVEVYPNPLLNDNLKLRTKNIEETLDITVINILGKEIYKTSASKNITTIDRSIFNNSGLYLIKVQSKKGIITKKIIVR